jgi:hypothetical protein
MNRYPDAVLIAIAVALLTKAVEKTASFTCAQ